MKDWNGNEVPPKLKIVSYFCRECQRSIPARQVHWIEDSPGHTVDVGYYVPRIVRHRVSRFAVRYATELTKGRAVTK